MRRLLAAVSALVLPLALGCAGEIDAGDRSGAAADAAPGGDGDGDDGDDGDDGEACLAVTDACESTDQCCDGLECGTTTLGQVCCGNAGASCGTPNGEDCCGDLLCIDGVCGGPGAIVFKAPFRCDERWTYSHHSAEVRLALDFIRDDGGTTGGSPVLASAGGVVSNLHEAGGAGNYVVIEHGGGWKTYYFHLSEFSAADGAVVSTGDQIGLTGTTGASSGPHIHYEQLLNGVGQNIVLGSDVLSPYPGTYGQKSVVSDNACP